MNHYELFYLISAQVPETELGKIQDEVTDWISGLEGRETKREQWGRRKLAYPIRKEKYGFYHLVEFDIVTERLKELVKKLNLHKTILRYLITEKHPMSAKELLMQEQARKRIQARIATKEADERAAAIHEKSGTKPPHPGAKKEPKISLEDLDKKLDELLDHDIIR